MPAVRAASILQGPALPCTAIAPNGLMTRPRSPWSAADSVSTTPDSAAAPYRGSSTYTIIACAISGPASPSETASSGSKP